MMMATGAQHSITLVIRPLTFDGTSGQELWCNSEVSNTVVAQALSAAVRW